MYGARRRRQLLGVVLVLLLAHTAGQLLKDTGHVRMPTPSTRNDHRRTYVPAVRWPLQGQAALVHGNGRPAASPREQPVPIASLAKVMTAYLTLKRYPLSGAQDGFTITITAMNAEARALGMDHTIYTDPSGFDPSTVSTAAGQLRVFQRAMRFPVFARSSRWEA